MKKIGTLNPQLSRVIAGMGHADKLVVCDSGLPIPHTHEVVDLSVSPNVPHFIDVVKVILEELQIEGAIVAREMEQSNRGVYNELMRLLPKVKLSKVTHEQFKQRALAGGNVTYVRTGEATPFANVILVSGVTFD